MMNGAAFDRRPVMAIIAALGATRANAASVEGGGSVYQLRIFEIFKQTTSCTLGGDGRTLFVATARIGLSDAQLDDAPSSGSLLQLDYEEVFR